MAVGSVTHNDEDKIGTSLATLDASNETKSYNVAQIFGSVRIKEIHIAILEVFSANIRNFFLDIWDGSTSVPISKNTTLTLDDAPIGSLITRIADASQALNYKSGAACSITENSSYRNPQTEVILTQKGDGTDTFLRLTYTTSDTPSSGKIRGFLRWSPVTVDGNLIVL